MSFTFILIYKITKKKKKAYDQCFMLTLRLFFLVFTCLVIFSELASKGLDGAKLTETHTTAPAKYLCPDEHFGLHE